MLDFNVSVSAHDWEHDLHYLVRLQKPIDLLLNCPPLLIQDIQRSIYEMTEVYKKNMVEKKFHLKVIK